MVYTSNPTTSPASILNMSTAILSTTFPITPQETILNSNSSIKVLNTSDIITLVLGFVAAIAAILALSKGWKCWRNKDKVGGPFKLLSYFITALPPILKSSMKEADVNLLD